MSAGEPRTLLSYQPGGWYFRQALRQTTDPVKLRQIGLLLSSEVETHRRFIRDLGHWPPLANDPAAALAEILGEPVRPMNDASQLKLLPDLE